ncbi:MAG: uroporphyrinogen-III C-methyltransferase [Rhodocyclaceae bacterium]|nr:uroporphyrinogen-III C-methyltransferase [Rhodocyclaceae bacterium]
MSVFHANPLPADLPLSTPKLPWLTRPLLMGALAFVGFLLLMLSGWQVHVRLAENRALSQQNLTVIESLQTRLNVMDARLSEAQAQQQAQEELIREFAKGRDARFLAEVSRISDQLNGVILTLDTLPLAFERRPPPAVKKKKTSPPPTQRAGMMDEAFWQQLAADFWRETRDLIRIERIEHLNNPHGGLIPLAPEQAFALRENIKLRLLSARLSLLSRDNRHFQNDIRLAREWMERHFDTQAKPVQAAMTTLRSLEAATP